MTIKPRQAPTKEDMVVNSLIRHLAGPASSRGWRVEGNVRTIAGVIILASLGLAVLDRRWLLLTAFVGVNLLQSGLSGWCLMSNLLALQGRSDGS